VKGWCTVFPQSRRLLLKTGKIHDVIIETIRGNRTSREETATIGTGTSQAIGGHQTTSIIGMAVVTAPRARTCRSPPHHGRTTLKKKALRVMGPVR
jgi:hypothetical protein